MNLMEVTDEGITELGIKVLLKHKPMTEVELTRAVNEFRKECIQAILIQMVLNQGLDMTWVNGELLFSKPYKEGAHG